MNRPDDGIWLNSREAAKLIGIEQSVIIRWIQSGKLIAKKDKYGWWWIKEEEARAAKKRKSPAGQFGKKRPWLCNNCRREYKGDPDKPKCPTCLADESFAVPVINLNRIRSGKATPYAGRSRWDMIANKLLLKAAERGKS